MTEFLGKSSVHPALLITAKMAVAVCWAYVPAQAFFLPSPGLAPPAIRAGGVALFIAGAVLLLLAISHLGRSIRVGLPSDSTELKTKRLYAISRNPMYMAVYLMCAGSVAYAPRLPNLAAAIVAVALHHKIVLAEEKFLDARFGNAWRAYAARVRRYV